MRVWRGLVLPCVCAILTEVDVQEAIQKRVGEKRVVVKPGGMLDVLQGWLLCVGQGLESARQFSDALFEEAETSYWESATIEEEADLSAFKISERLLPGIISTEGKIPNVSFNDLASFAELDSSSVKRNFIKNALTYLFPNSDGQLEVHGQCTEKTQNLTRDENAWPTLALFLEEGTLDFADCELEEQWNSQGREDARGFAHLYRQSPGSRDNEGVERPGKKHYRLNRLATLLTCPQKTHSYNSDARHASLCELLSTESTEITATNIDTGTYMLIKESLFSVFIYKYAESLNDYIFLIQLIYKKTVNTPEFDLFFAQEYSVGTHTRAVLKRIVGDTSCVPASALRMPSGVCRNPTAETDRCFFKDKEMVKQENTLPVDRAAQMSPLNDVSTQTEEIKSTVQGQRSPEIISSYTLLLLMNYLSYDKSTDSFLVRCNGRNSLSFLKSYYTNHPSTRLVTFKAWSAWKSEMQRRQYWPADLFERYRKDFGRPAAYMLIFTAMLGTAIGNEELLTVIIEDTVISPFALKDLLIRFIVGYNKDLRAVESQMAVPSLNNCKKDEEDSVIEDQIRVGNEQPTYSSHKEREDEIEVRLKFCNETKPSFDLIICFNDEGIRVESTYQSCAPTNQLIDREMNELRTDGYVELISSKEDERTDPLPSARALPTIDMVDWLVTHTRLLQLQRMRTYEYFEFNKLEFSPTFKIRRLMNIFLARMKKDTRSSKAIAERLINKYLRYPCTRKAAATYTPLQLISLGMLTAISCEQQANIIDKLGFLTKIVPHTFGKLHRAFLTHSLMTPAFINNAVFPLLLKEEAQTLQTFKNLPILPISAWRLAIDVVPTGSVKRALAQISSAKISNPNEIREKEIKSLPKSDLRSVETDSFNLLRCFYITVKLKSYENALRYLESINVPELVLLLAQKPEARSNTFWLTKKRRITDFEIFELAATACMALKEPERNADPSQNILSRNQQECLLFILVNFQPIDCRALHMATIVLSTDVLRLLPLLFVATRPCPSLETLTREDVINLRDATALYNLILTEREPKEPQLLFEKAMWRFVALSVRERSVSAHEESLYKILEEAIPCLEGLYSKRKYLSANTYQNLENCHRVFYKIATDIVLSGNIEKISSSANVNC